MEELNLPEVISEPMLDQSGAQEQPKRELRLIRGCWVRELLDGRWLVRFFGQVGHYLVTADEFGSEYTVEEPRRRKFKVLAGKCSCGAGRDTTGRMCRHELVCDDVEDHCKWGRRGREKLVEKVPRLQTLDGIVHIEPTVGGYYVTRRVFIEAE